MKNFSIHGRQYYLAFSTSCWNCSACKVIRSSTTPLVRSHPFRRVRRYSYQNIDTHGFACFHGGLERPLAERQLCRGIHFVGQTTKNLQVRYFAVLADPAFQNYEFMKLFKWQWSALEIKARFRFGRHQGLLHVNNAGVRLGNRHCTGSRRLAELQRPTLAGRRKKDGIDFSAMQSAINVQAATTHWTSGDH